MTPPRTLSVVAGLWFACAATWAGTPDYGARVGTQRAGEVSWEPGGPGVLFDALTPTLHHWYIPQELHAEYRWRQWEYTNYARYPYERYVNTLLEGDYFYDFYGDLVSRGWLIYDWRQDQPKPEGSSLFKTSQFERWLTSLTIGSDERGQHAYAITVGNRIRTTLTPMTFSKPTFNGVQADFLSDKYALTVLASRISNPLAGTLMAPQRQTNSTSMVAGRATAQVGDFITIGGTLVDARHSNAALDMFDGNFVAGNLTAGQSGTPVSAIAVILSDDSPQDGKGGAALFAHDIRITSRDFDTGDETLWTLEQVVRPDAQWPAVFGGFERAGFLAADGDERVILNYDFTDPDYIGPDVTSIVDVEFDYVLANDFRIEMWSNKQTGRRAVPLPPLTADVIAEREPALLLVKRAAGNVEDISNIQRVRFDYGLPTASVVAGFTLEGKNIWGIDFYGEWDRNFRYFQYPNAALFHANEGHEISRQTADAGYLTISKQQYPFFAYGEAYDIDFDYTTNVFIVDTSGDIEYDAPGGFVYEFVEDNDDQDALPDWVRAGSQAGDTDVFPGWDENNDFISDFNQNDNRAVPNAFPDYEEPFLRYDVDRPEFLFGIDLNNNGWIDRFEDDELPDYPYKGDRKGYNAFVGAHLAPNVRVMVGRTDERMLSDDRDNVTTYGLLTLDKSCPGLGRLRVFDMLKRASDTIPDDRLQASAVLGEIKRPVVADILPAQDTWINTAWLQFDYTAIPQTKVVNKLKYESLSHTDDDARDLDNRPMAASPSTFGLINKVEYDFDLGPLALRPRLKSEYLRRDSFVQDEEDQEHWLGLVMLTASFPYMSHSTITTGLELAQFQDRAADEDAMVALGQVGETGDERSLNVALQLTNQSSYEGYLLTTQVGLRLARIFAERVRGRATGGFEKVSKGRTETTSFIAVYAGIQ